MAAPSGGQCAHVVVALQLLCITWLGALVQLGSSSAQAEPTRELRLEILDRAAKGGGLVVIGRQGARTKRVEVSSEMAARLAGIRFSVECEADEECHEQRLEPIEGRRRVFDSHELGQILAEGGTRMLMPFAEEIRRATRLRIHLPKHLLKIAIDVLEFDGEPLYVKLPIVYTIDQDIAPASTTINPSSVGLLISDPTADPQRAVNDVSDLFPRSMLFDAVDFDMAKLQPAERIDFAVISAHGRAGYADRDEIGLPRYGILAPEILARMRPQLIYFDSCNMGVSHRYINELQSMGVNYVLAPIISNEAGDSSTLTMRMFFTEVLARRDPVTALHVARAHAYEVYGRRDRMAGLLQAFPFRIYALN